MNRRLLTSLLPVLGLHLGACVVATVAVRGASVGVGMKTHFQSVPAADPNLHPSVVPSYRLESWQLEQKIRTA
jgi:hypothetical protein